MAAAALWLLSAVVRLPKDITVGYGGVGGSVQELADKLRLQGYLSAGAALLTGIGTLLSACAL